jgi:hypothetical protein
VIRIERNPSPRQLRQFSGVWIGFFALLGAVMLMRHGGSRAAAVFALGLAAGVPGLIFPTAIKPIYLAASYASFPVGWLVSHVALAGVYYFVFTPAGVIMRLLGRDPLERRFDPGRESYWKPYEAQTRPDRYFRQY